MSASGSKAMLLDATRQLQARWAETRAAWRDQKAADFEDQFLSQLTGDVHLALRVIDELDKILHQIHVDCE
jgi:hypothetical protein